MKEKIFLKLLSCTLCFFIATSTILQLPATATELYSKTYKYEDFEITYDIVAAWNNMQHINITIKNTGETDINDWELYYNIDGNITSIWNAVIGINENGTEHIKCESYNSVITVGNVVVFGYLIENGEAIPDNFSMYPNDNNADEYVIYYKDIESEDDIAYDNDGDRYFKNQIIITATEDASFNEIQVIADTLSANIVGYIELTNQYQLEFMEDVNIDRIENIIANIEQEAEVQTATINYIFDLPEADLPNDVESNLQGEASANNWNLTAINAPNAWKYIDRMNTVNLGIMDAFFYKHDDIKYADIYEQNTNVENYHGTFVAGIMAAEFDNNCGISGICPNNKLYAYSMKNSVSSFKYISALSKLIQENIKVINVSLTTFRNKGDEAQKEAINSGDTKELSKYNISTSLVDTCLCRQLKKGYDFVIVVAAGNDGKKGYDAQFANYLNNINSSAKNNIIVVGGLSYDGYSKNEEIDINYEELTYKFSDTSNVGERIDVVAPGVNIHSLFSSGSYIGGEYQIKSDYKNYEGTSFAAPHVSGIAGIMYSVNPNISGFEVKEIIKTTSQLRKVADNHGYEYGIADAKLAVSTAYYCNPDNTDKIIFGKLKDFNDTSKVYGNTELKVSYSYNGFTTISIINSDENGEFELVVPKDVDVNSLVIHIDGYGVINTDVLGVFFSSSVVMDVIITPIEASIYGTVTVKNLTTNKITPKAGHTVTLLKDGSNFTSVSTQDDGTYRINLKEYGNYTIVFSEDYQYEVPITSNLNCEINCVFEVEEDEDEDEEDEDENDEGDDGNSDEDDNGNTDDGNFGEGDGINIDFTGDGDSSFTGDESGNLSDGVWLKIFDGADSYYARIYTTSDSGEYKSTFGSPGWGLHTTMYNYWTGQLKMATYRCDGTLIKDQVIEYFYKKTHIYLPNSNSTDTTPLMRIDAITSLSIDSTGVTYTIHTDGYYKETFNIVGSLGVKKEDWTDDKTITISLYKGSSPTGASTASPFEN